MSAASSLVRDHDGRPADLLLRSVIELVPLDPNTPLVTTARALFERLRPKANQAAFDGCLWPRSPQALVRRLNGHADELRRQGFAMLRRASTNGPEFEIWRRDPALSRAA